jgi:hypothetical protein
MRRDIDPLKKLDLLGSEPSIVTQDCDTWPTGWRPQGARQHRLCHRPERSPDSIGPSDFAQYMAVRDLWAAEGVSSNVFSALGSRLPAMTAVPRHQAPTRGLVYSPEGHTQAHVMRPIMGLRLRARPTTSPPSTTRPTPSS